MSENYQRWRHIFIKTIVKVLMVVLVTVVGTFLYIRSDQIQRSFSVYHMIDSGVKTQNPDLFLLVTNATVITVTTEAALDVTHAAQKRKELKTTEEDVAVTMVKELNNPSTLKDLQTNSRSLNTDIVQETNFIIRPMTSNSGISPVYGNIIKENHSLINHKSVNNMVDNYRVYNKIGTTDNDRLYDTTKNESDQMIHYGYFTTEPSTSVAKEDASNSYYNVNDLSYNVDEYKYKEVKIPSEDIKLTTNGQSEPIHIDEFLSSGSVGGSDGSSYGQNSYYDLKSRYPTGHTIYNRPSTTKPKKLYQPSKELDQPYEKIITQYPISSKTNWKNIGVLPLIKLGILKLKMIGFLQLMFLIGFKFKLFMIAIFLKFILLLKLMKFFKILILPVYIFSLFPILTSLYNRMVNMKASNGPSGSSSLGSSSFSSVPGFMSSGGFSSSSSSGGTQLPVSSGGFSGGSMLPFSSASSNGGIRLPGLTDGTLSPGLSRVSSKKLHSDLAAINIIPKRKQSHYFAYKLDDSNVFNKHNYKMLDFSDSTMSIFQKLLNSEKCVENLACQMMAGEKTGIIPLWINWILHGFSIIMPNEKLQLYFKTYNDINHIHTKKSSASENWETWCLKRYKCHNY